MSAEAITGGCQCGAVRYRVEALGRASICHCRMCQKAFGGFFGPLVTGKGLAWTRGKPATFASSNKISRGFCEKCGTPISYQGEKWPGETHFLVGGFDDPSPFTPTGDVFKDEALAWCAPDERA